MVHFQVVLDSKQNAKVAFTCTSFQELKKNYCFELAVMEHYWEVRITSIFAYCAHGLSIHSADRVNEASVRPERNKACLKEILERDGTAHYRKFVSLSELYTFI